MYDPTPGRFLQQDPLEFDAGDPNLYRYVGNSPTNETDPTGQAALSRQQASYLRRMIQGIKKAFEEYIARNPNANDPGRVAAYRNLLNLELLNIVGTDTTTTTIAYTVIDYYGYGVYTDINYGNTSGRWLSPDEFYDDPLGSETYVSQQFWQLTVEEQIKTIIHESYHAGGYWARIHQTRFTDRAEEWSTLTIARIYDTYWYTQTRARYARPFYSGFNGGSGNINDPNYRAR